MELHEPIGPGTPYHQRIQELQRKRLHRSLLTALCYVPPLAILWGAWALGQTRVPLIGGILLSIVLLAPPLTFVTVFHLRWNLILRDPDLILAQLLGHTIGLVMVGSIAGPPLPIYLMGCLVALLFSAPKIPPRQMIGVAVLILATAITTTLLANGDNLAALPITGLTLVGFAVTCAAIFYHGIGLNESRLERNRDAKSWQRAIDRLRQNTTTDELTGIHNRRYMMEALRRDKSLADRGSYPFVICFADLDHFKMVNDRYGHARGDTVIQHCAQILSSTIRGGDYVARYGGEEFVMVLVDAKLETGCQIAERVRERVEEYWSDRKMSRVRITISIGLTQYRENELLAGALARADGALYAAKKQGRNRIVAVS